MAERVLRGDPHTTVKQELLVRYLDAWTPTVLRSYRRATYLEASRDGSVAAALRVFGEFADRIEGHQLDVVVLGSSAEPLADETDGLALRTVERVADLEVAGPVLAHLDLVGDGPLDEAAAWRLVPSLAKGKARELLITLPAVGAPQVAEYRVRLRQAGLTFVAAVELADDSGRTQLLVFATAVEKHLSAFKDARRVPGRRPAAVRPDRHHLPPGRRRTGAPPWRPRARSPGSRRRAGWRRRPSWRQPNPEAPRTSAAPGTGDREHVSRVLDVGEQDLAVGAEGGAGELAVVEIVTRQRVRLAAGGDADQVLDAFAVLGQDQAAVRVDHDVVRAVEVGVLGRVRVDLEDRGERDGLVLRVVEPYLAVVLVDAAVGGTREAGDEVRAAVAPVRALQLPAAGHLVVRELLAHRGGGGVPVRYVDPAHLVPGARGGRLGQVGDVLAAVRAAHRLQLARGVAAGAQGECPQRALAALEARRRDPPEVEAVRVVRVLGEVDPGVARLHRDRFVGVPAEELQGYGVGVGGAVERVHLEGVPVVLLECAAGPLLGLFAGQPGVPGGTAAGAVVVGAGDADVLGDPLAGLVDLDRRGAAPGAL